MIASLLGNQTRHRSIIVQNKGKKYLTCRMRAFSLVFKIEHPHRLKERMVTDKEANRIPS